MLVLLLAGTLLTLVFTALAFLVSVRVDDRARGLGVAILVWLGFSVLYDGAGDAARPTDSPTTRWRSR